MTRRTSLIWRVGAVIFTFVNAAGAVYGVLATADVERAFRSR